MTLPSQRRYVFADGSNVLSRFVGYVGAQAGIPLEKELQLPSDPPLKYLELALEVVRMGTSYVGGLTVRQYWFGSWTNPAKKGEMENLLRRKNWEPILVQRREKGEKGVDVALVIEMLTHAYNRNMELATLVAGDEDFVQLVEEVKRYGARVGGSFFEGPGLGLAPNLKLKLDTFRPLVLSPSKLDGEERTINTAAQYAAALREFLPRHKKPRDKKSHDEAEEAPDVEAEVAES
jgi:hypothetical protein